MKLMALLALLFSANAMAHYADPTGGSVAGFIHLFTGWDHFLAMVAVGILSSRYGDALMWKVPAAFIVSVLVGMHFGLNAYHVPYVTLAMGVSLVMLGLLITRPIEPNVWIMVAGVLFFGIFHGYEHGVEMLGIANVQGFKKGFFFGSVVIHFIGVMVGLVPERFALYHKSLRTSGYVCCLLGLGVVAGVM
ncbi:HupE/UreJ family protein [Vibrio sp. WXL103]|uniref:HupE/UreJ family protein n=1 Tax=unclassified Vibrio TaxID=2614977 RepID=UPI003EC58D8B